MEVTSKLARRLGLLSAISCSTLAIVLTVIYEQDSYLPLTQIEESGLIGAIPDLRPRTSRCAAQGNCPACAEFQACQNNPNPDPFDPFADPCVCTGGQTGCQNQAASLVCTSVCSYAVYKCSPLGGNQNSECGFQVQPSYKLVGGNCMKDVCKLTVFDCGECKEVIVI